MSSWDDFLDTADQFFVSYSAPPHLVPVKLFEVGHTVELYLKAACSKRTGDVQEAISKSHKIKSMWDDCKEHDVMFLPQFEIRDSVFNSDFLFDGGMSLSRDDQIHYFANQELYLIAKHLADLKYIGAPPKSPKMKGRGTLWPMMVQNPYWITFLREFRRYLDWPPPRHYDQIKLCIANEEMQRSSKAYLSNLYK